jgi:hypothetical protein
MRANYKFSNRQELRRNRILRNRHRGGRCFIIGNGPSLNSQDVSSLANEITFACNFFNLHPLCEVLRPRYYCIADPLSFAPVPGTADIVSDRAAWFGDILQKIPDVEFFVPLWAKSIIEERGWLKNRPVWHVAFGGSSTEAGHAQSALHRPITLGQGTIPALAIPTAIYMGFSTIYLLGCDCDWWVSNLAQGAVTAEHKHFYSKNPFIPYQGSFADLELESQFLSLHQHFKSFRLLKEHADKRSIKIINLTRGGLLEAFPRERFEDVVPQRESNAINM